MLSFECTNGGNTVFTIKRYAALLCAVLLCLSSVCRAEDTADVIRKLLAAGETSKRPQIAVNDVHTTVNFDLLFQLNPDCIAWIYQDESGLNAPIMQNQDNELYYEHAFDKIKVYQTGSVYMNWQDSLDDRVVTIRGQAREEGCLNMIPDWREQENYEKRTPFRLLTPAGDYQAEVFACLAVERSELDSWYPPTSENRFDGWLDRVLEASLIQPDQLSLPDVDDRLLFIAGQHRNGSFTLLMAALGPIVYTTDVPCDLIKKPLDEAQTQNDWVNVGPMGPMMVYAQNDPLFAQMRYESALTDVYRDFEGGGCGPTAVAMIVANLVEKEDLPTISQYAKNELGNLFCACSVNRVYCSHLHPPYQMVTPDEYLRYLPVAIADFAAGNNTWDLNARRVGSTGTNIRFVEYVCNVYNLSYTPITGLDAALEHMTHNTGLGLVLASALRGSPFSNSSHFVVIAGVDDEYFYVLDPLRRTEEEYRKTDKRHILDLIAPGVARIRLEDFGRSDLSPVAYISRTDWEE